MNGKGDTPRPLSVTPDTYAANYARIQWTALYEDRREAMRQANLEEARHTILNAPPMSDAMRDTLARYAQPDPSSPESNA